MSAPGRAASRGMTLIEIMIVIAIIGLIMGGLAFALMGRFTQAQLKTAATEVKRLQTTIEMFQLEKGRCPKDQAELGVTGYLKHIKNDPWGTPYAFTCPGEHDVVDVSSAGPDAEPDTEDDIVSWEEKDDAESDRPERRGVHD